MWREICHRARAYGSRNLCIPDWCTRFSIWSFALLSPLVNFSSSLSADSYGLFFLNILLSLFLFSPIESDLVFYARQVLRAGCSLLKQLRSDAGGEVFFFFCVLPRPRWHLQRHWAHFFKTQVVPSCTAITLFCLSHPPGRGEPVKYLDDCFDFDFAFSFS